jgi:hypothetical protein
MKAFMAEIQQSERLGQTPSKNLSHKRWEQRCKLQPQIRFGISQGAADFVHNQSFSHFRDRKQKHVVASFCMFLCTTF